MMPVRSTKACCQRASGSAEGAVKTLKVSCLVLSAITTLPLRCCIIAGTVLGLRTAASRAASAASACRFAHSATCAPACASSPSSRWSTPGSVTATASSHCSPASTTVRSSARHGVDSLLRRKPRARAAITSAAIAAQLSLLLCSTTNVSLRSCSHATASSVAHTRLASAFSAAHTAASRGGTVAAIASPLYPLSGHVRAASSRRAARSSVPPGPLPFASLVPSPPPASSATSAAGASASPTVQSGDSGTASGVACSAAATSSVAAQLPSGAMVSTSRQMRARSSQPDGASSTLRASITWNAATSSSKVRPAARKCAKCGAVSCCRSASSFTGSAPRSSSTANTSAVLAMVGASTTSVVGP